MIPRSLSAEAGAHTKPIAIFDIDGTIFRSSLVVELVRDLVKKHVVPKKALQAMNRAERKWLNREGGYDPYIDEVVSAYRHLILGRKRSEVVSSAKRVINSQKLRTYRYTKNLLTALRGKFFTIAISGSPLEVVREYNKFLKFDKIYGTENGVDRHGRYTGKVLREPPAYKKELVVRYVKDHGLSLRRSVGVGDTDSDIGFLELVDRPIAFNPNTGLAQAARQRGWKIVIERKDLVVEFDPRTAKFVKI